MKILSALLVTLEATKKDANLQAGGRGARKILVTELYPNKEGEAVEVEWHPPASSDKCPVQVMKDTEVAVFTHLASQDRHYHEIGTEIYLVLEGEMIVEVEAKDYCLSTGDMIVVNPTAVHRVKPKGTEFICRVVTANCGGASDKYVV